ncbi:MAG: chromosomal replication initiator protein DnaA [Phycisphaerales bacterium]
MNGPPHRSSTQLVSKSSARKLMITMGQVDRYHDRKQDQAVLNDVLAQIRAQHPEHARKWFDELEPLGTVASSFGIRAQSEMHRDYLRRTCLDAFNEALRDITLELLAVRFLGPQDQWETPPNTPKKSNKQAIPNQLPAQQIEHSPSIKNDHTASIPPTERAPVTQSQSNSIWADEAGVPQNELDRQSQTNNQTVNTPIVHASSERSRLDSSGALPINPDYGFGEFVIGPNNRLAHAASVAVSENPGFAYNPLFIHGGVGLGKTHLLQAICLKITQENPGINLHYVSCDGFMTQFMNAVQSGQMAEFRHTFRDIDLLVIDDIHFLARRDRTQEEFFHTFNALYQGNKQIILSSDAPPEEIPDLEERLVSRFMWGLVAKVEKPGFETRIEILKRKADARGIKLPEPVVTEIAHYIDTNIRELEGAITKLQIFANVEKRDIDLDLARDALGQEFASAVSAQGTGPTIERIISEISGYYSVKRTEILGKRRHKSIALPRQVGMYLTRKYTRHSLEEIGAHYGGRDHTTVMHAVKTITARSKEDESLHSDVLAIESRLRVGSGS